MGRWRSPRGAHPHSRGENCRWALICARSAGSSPLTRGKQGASGVQERGHGLIPTHAGKTTPPSTNSEPLRAHPHSRGENSAYLGGEPADGGSSPLTRGKPCERKRTTPLCGLIPTHAGKTSRSGPDRHVAQAHPHSRGENAKPRERPGSQRGSSPLTRGKLSTSARASVRQRLIPTHAGKTNFLRRAS